MNVTRPEVVTYIVVLKYKEFYCGKTTNLGKRLLDHKHEKKPHWFGYSNRNKNIISYLYVKGDFEKKIKSFGIKRFYNCFVGLHFVGGLVS